MGFDLINLYGDLYGDGNGEVDLLNELLGKFKFFPGVGGLVGVELGCFDNFSGVSNQKQSIVDAGEIEPNSLSIDFRTDEFDSSGMTTTGLISNMSSNGSVTVTG